MDKTIELAREAGLFTHKEVQAELKAFEALVRADERSACCDAIWKCDGMGLEDRFIAMDVIKAKGNT
jgi:hypothetical protein